MSQTKFCPYCGAKNEYSYNPPKFCGQCGKALDSFVFAPSSVTLARSVTKIYTDPEEESEVPPLSADLVNQFAEGVTTDARGMQKVTVKDLINHEEMGVRGARPGLASIEGLEVIEKGKTNYACLDPKNFPQRPTPKPVRARKFRKSSK
jgi:hypothetical protein